MPYELFKMLLEYTARTQDLGNGTSLGNGLSNKLTDSLGSSLPISQPYKSSNCWPFHFENLIKRTLEQSFNTKLNVITRVKKNKTTHNTLPRKVSHHSQTYCYIFPYLSIISMSLFQFYLQIEENSLIVLTHESFHRFTIRVCLPELQASFS